MLQFSSRSDSRVLSIDTLRGITILVMIFVNELSGVANIPAWMKHMPADADAMTFVDVVFPAFLFIVGMSIPFAIENRKIKGDNTLKLQLHILFRTLGLLVLGVFMVNAESGYNEAAMGMPIHVWSLLFFLCAILVWNVYTFKNKTVPWILRGTGVLGLLVLGILYRGGENGTETLQPQWWGILGLIGWAYFISCLLYQLVRANLIALLGLIVLALAYYITGEVDTIRASSFAWLFSQGGHAIHSMIVLAGVVLSFVFFNQLSLKSSVRRFVEAAFFTAVLVMGAYFFRPAYTISKIYATPSWAMYSAAICCALFAFLYWLIDLKKVNGWTAFLRPAATNPLLTYIVPYLVGGLMALAGLSWPNVFYNGIYGILWSMVFAIAVMCSVILLNRMKIRLQL